MQTRRSNMLWFAAHAVHVFELVSGRQTTFKVLEDVLMIRARNAKSALAAALRQVKRETVVDETLTLGNRPARQRFLGIRKVVECAADLSDRTSHGGEVREMKSGVEATYQFYRIKGRDELKRLMQGKDVEVILEE